MQLSDRVRNTSLRSLAFALVLASLACYEGARRVAADSSSVAVAPQPAATRQPERPTLNLPEDSALAIVNPDSLFVAAGAAYRYIRRVDLDGLVGVHAQRQTRFGAFRLDSAHIIDHRRSGETAFVLLTVAGFSGATPVGGCDSTGRERFLLWVPLFKGRDTHPEPVSFRYRSCWYSPRTTGLVDSGGSVTVTAAFSHFAKRVVATYDRDQPARGIQLAMFPIDTAAFSDSVARQDSIDGLDEERRNTPKPVLRNAAAVTWLPAIIRDTLAARR